MPPAQSSVLGPQSAVTHCSSLIAHFSFLLLASVVLWTSRPIAAAEPPDLRVGAAAAELKADDSMIIGGGIGGGTVAAQEGKLRAVALVLQSGDSTKLAIVACDILMIEREFLDAAARQIERDCGIPFANILINSTHTHHAPSPVTIHGYQRDEEFCRRVQQGVVDAVSAANEKLKTAGPATFQFCLGEESSVGQNSRLLLGDGTIYWVGPHDDAVRPTGPFDPELPVLAFRRQDESLEALMFNHSTHTIGTRMPGHRSPSFYGLAAQELEEELGGTVLFLEGASGSTHNLGVPAGEMVVRIKNAVRDSLAEAEPMPVPHLASLKREIAVTVRRFDEQKEDEAVRSYCEKRIPQGAAGVVEVFRSMRKVLAPQQGRERKTWVQAVRIGDVALVGVPGEFFTKLGLEIKRRSPFRYTYVAELANDWVGYIPDDKAYDLGGYQVWTGLHSYVARGTGEAIVREAVQMLEELHASAPQHP